MAMKIALCLVAVAEGPLTEEGYVSNTWQLIRSESKFARLLQETGPSILEEAATVDFKISGVASVLPLDAKGRPDILRAAGLSKWIDHRVRSVRGGMFHNEKAFPWEYDVKSSVIAGILSQGAMSLAAMMNLPLAACRQGRPRIAVGCCLLAEIGPEGVTRFSTKKLIERELHDPDAFVSRLRSLTLSDAGEAGHFASYSLPESRISPAPSDYEESLRRDLLGLGLQMDAEVSPLPAPPEVIPSRIITASVKNRIV